MCAKSVRHNYYINKGSSTFPEYYKINIIVLEKLVYYWKNQRERLMSEQKSCVYFAIDKKIYKWEKYTVSYIISVKHNYHL